MITDRLRSGWYRTARLRRGLVVFLTVLSTALVISLTAATTPVRASSQTVVADGLGCGSAEVTRTLSTGSAWRMCIHVHPIKGLVLEKVQFRPATGDREFTGWLPVIDSVYLAQLVVPYDHGLSAFNDITDYGFGDRYILSQNDQTCLGDTMTIRQSTMDGTTYNSRTIPGICLDEVDTGLSWGSQGPVTDDNGVDRYSQQGRAFEVSSISKISWYEYQQKVTLTDQGTITLGLGATGDLAPDTFYFGDDHRTGWPIGPAHEDPQRYATSHWHNAVYRVDFGIGSGDQQVQQWDYTRPDPDLKYRLDGTGTVRTEAFHADDDVDPQTWWRVLNPQSLNRDGHARSYEIVNDAIQNPYDDLTRPKVSFTNDHPCQEYASDNLNVGCPGQSVPDYVAAETAPLTDPVAWVNVGFHHIDRDEDQSPMPVHWQEFSLVPRDLLAQQATTPIERSCVNGGPFLVRGSCAAVSLAPPQIAVGPIPPAVGTVLTSDNGRWRPARSPLSFQKLWLRDGQPITSPGPNGLPASATGEQYTVTAADLGHRISVRIDAAGDGVIPGSATSAALLIPRLNPPPPPPNPRISPTIITTVPAKGPSRLIVRVRGKAGVATGRVVVRGPRAWQRVRTLTRGRTVVRVPRTLALKRARVAVRYRGDARYLPVQRKIRLR